MNLREIAKQAGVSLTTVSLVLNGKPGISSETRERVKDLLRQNGYDVEGKSKSNRSICFLKYLRHAHLVNGNPGFVTQIMDAVEQECRKSGYDLQVVTIDASLSSAALKELIGKPAIKGTIFLGTELIPNDMAPFLPLEKPLLVVDNSLSCLPVSSVTMDNQQAIFSVVEHLAQLGYKKIGFFYNSLPASNDQERRAAFQNAMHHLGLPFDTRLVFPVFPTMEGAYRSTRELLEAGVALPCAIVANNDSIAIGAMRALKDFGLRVPEDISIVGFDGLPFSALADPPLTTVNVSCEDIGYWAMQILLNTINGLCTTPCKMVIGTQLNVRGSTIPAHPVRPHPRLLPD